MKRKHLRLYSTNSYVGDGEMPSPLCAQGSHPSLQLEIRQVKRPCPLGKQTAMEIQGHGQSPTCVPQQVLGGSGLGPAAEGEAAPRAGVGPLVHLAPATAHGGLAGAAAVLQ